MRISPTAMRCQRRSAQEKLDPDVLKPIQFAERNDLPFAGEDSLNRLAGQ